MPWMESRCGAVGGLGVRPSLGPGVGSDLVCSFLLAAWCSRCLNGACHDD